MKKVSTFAKSIFASAYLATAFSLPAYATEFSYTSTGIITIGTDSLGIFGQTGESLVGNVFSLTTSFDATPADLTNPNEIRSYGFSSPFAVSATVNGVTYSTQATFSTFALINNTLSAGIQNSGVPYPYDEAYSTAAGNDSADNFVFTYQYLFAHSSPFVGTSLDFGSNLSFAAKVGDSILNNFVLQNSAGEKTSFYSDLSLGSFVQINGSSSNVPEPASVVLFGFGLLALATSRREAAKK